MLSIILHLFIGTVQRFLLGIGGITRWFIFRAYNALYFEKFPKDLDYYIDYKSNLIDKNGFTIQNKNSFAGIIVIVLVILLLEKFENK